MSIQTTCRYIYILFFSLAVVCAPELVRAQTADTTAVDTTEDNEHKVKIEPVSHQLCLGVDIFHPIVNQFVKSSYGYEFSADYYLRKEFYAVAEAGWGGADVSYTDLKYTTTNKFLRLGFNKSVLSRDAPWDWDMMVMGLRVGASYIQRSPASFIVQDTTWGNVPGTQPGKDFMAYWAEVVGGMRVEITRGISAGWLIRGKFMLNSRSFKDLSPLYIAGFGRGDKNAVFDFNMYINYSIRWRRK